MNDLKFTTAGDYMNEQIQELAKEAGLLFQRDKLSYAEQKFAELIVKKCMAVAKYHTPDIEECEHTWLIHDKIKQHFGVEE